MQQEGRKPENGQFDRTSSQILRNHKMDPGSPTLYRTLELFGPFFPLSPAADQPTLEQSLMHIYHFIVLAFPTQSAHKAKSSQCQALLQWLTEPV